MTCRLVCLVHLQRPAPFLCHWPRVTAHSSLPRELPSMCSGHEQSHIHLYFFSCVPPYAACMVTFLHARRYRVFESICAQSRALRICFSRARRGWVSRRVTFTPTAPSSNETTLDLLKVGPSRSACLSTSTLCTFVWFDFSTSRVCSRSGACCFSSCWCCHRNLRSRISQLRAHWSRTCRCGTPVPLLPGTTVPSPPRVLRPLRPVWLQHSPKRQQQTVHLRG